jgi:hypothetical protein
VTHLWDVDHDYYCSDENYYQNGTQKLFESWAEFMEAEGDAEMDRNLVFRWDWREGEGWELGDYNGDDYYRYARIQIYIMNQRHGAFRSASVKVCRADEADIIAYLRPRWENLAELWAPINSQD